MPLQQLCCWRQRDGDWRASRWLDVHKHYESDHRAGQHLLDIYHAMAHQNEFMQKQVRRHVQTPLQSLKVVPESGVMHQLRRAFPLGTGGAQPSHAQVCLQARNFLFVTPLTSFDFGEWKPMDDYVAMACEHFSNSMHVVFDQVPYLGCSVGRSPRRCRVCCSAPSLACTCRRRGGGVGGTGQTGRWSRRCP